MGMSIDKTIEFFDGLECHTPQAKDAKDVAMDTMRKYQMFQADYEKRLREDMVAMLEEIQLEIEDNEKPISATSYDGDLYNGAFNDGLWGVSDIIQQKIDKLKEVKDGKDND